MNILFKQFSTERLRFSSELNANELIAKFRSFCDRGMFDFSINLDGEVKGTNDFDFTKKWQFSNSTGSSMNAKLNAKVVKSYNGTVVEVAIRPSYNLVMLAVIFIFFGLVTMINAVIGETFEVDNLLAGLIITTGITSIMAIGCYMAKNGLIDRFSETFNLTKL